MTVVRWGFNQLGNSQSDTRLNRPMIYGRVLFLYQYPEWREKGTEGNLLKRTLKSDSCPTHESQISP